MILGNEKSKIVELAVKNQSAICDGVVQYDYEDGKLFGAGFTTGTVENPENPFIEVFRLPQGERGKINYDCDECWTNDGTVAMKCCMEAYIDDDFDDDFEDNFRESVEEQVRDVLGEYLDDTISKLNEIRIAISDRLAPYDYFNVRQDDWEMRVKDSYVDNAMEYGFTVPINPNDYLDAEIQNLAEVRFRDGENKEFWGKVGCLIEDCDFDGALKLLQ